MRRDPTGQTALSLAAGHTDSLPLVQMLLDAAPEAALMVDFFGMLPLHHALRQKPHGTDGTRRNPRDAAAVLAALRAAAPTLPNTPRVDEAAGKVAAALYFSAAGALGRERRRHAAVLNDCCDFNFVSEDRLRPGDYCYLPPAELAAARVAAGPEVCGSAQDDGFADEFGFDDDSEDDHSFEEEDSYDEDDSYGSDDFEGIPECRRCGYLFSQCHCPNGPVAPRGFGW